MKKRFPAGGGGKPLFPGDFAYGKQRCWKIQGGQCCNRPVTVPFLSNFALTREQCGDKIIHELRYRSSVEGDFKWIIKHNIIRSWVTADEAVKVIKSGDWVDYAWTTGTPVALDAGAAARADELEDVRFEAVSCCGLRKSLK